MAVDQTNVSGPDGGDESSTKAEQERLPNGRFAAGHSGNRAGRPPKRAPSVADDLDRILERKTPSNNPAFADLTLREGLLLSMCLQGLKNYRAALAVFNLRATAQNAAAGGGSSEDGRLGGADALEHHIERAIRRRNLQDNAGEDGDGEGSP